MKKVLVIMLASLLLFSFTSCSNDNSSKIEEQKKEYEEKLQTEKDKQEAMIKAFEDFMAAYKTDIAYLKTLWNGYDRDSVFRLTQGTVNVTLSEYKVPNIAIGDFKDFIELEDGQAVSGVHPCPDPAPTGTVTGTATGTSNMDLTFTDNKFTFNYYVYNINDENQTAVRTDKLDVTINGTFKEEDTDEKHVVDYNITINDKTFQLSYTYDKKTKKVTAASVNGTDVEIRLFNADGLSLVK